MIFFKKMNDILKKINNDKKIRGQNYFNFQDRIKKFKPNEKSSLRPPKFQARFCVEFDSCIVIRQARWHSLSRGIIIYVLVQYLTVE
jgi:hypothetical protein